MTSERRLLVSGASPWKTFWVVGAGPRLPVALQLRRHVARSVAGVDSELQVASQAVIEPRSTGAGCVVPVLGRLGPPVDGGMLVAAGRSVIWAHCRRQVARSLLLLFSASQPLSHRPRCCCRSAMLGPGGVDGVVVPRAGVTAGRTAGPPGGA